MKIPTTTEDTYVPHWGAEEGIREAVQNGKDAETEFDAKLKVWHRNNVLRIQNDGCTLDKSAILMGRTSKRDRIDMIGKWGEGLPIGCLAIVRAGYEMRIRTGSEVWIPRIEESDKFDGARILVFEILPGRKFRNRVCVEISSVSADEWATVRTRFLFLDKPKKDEIICTDAGDLLLSSSSYQGKLFIKGIFVQHDATLTHGYNYKHADYDRDRRMVEDFDKRANNRRIWEEAVARHPKRLFKTYYKLLDEGAQDLAGVTQYSTPYMNQDTIEDVVKAFIEEHGEDAVAVENLGECQDLEHLGKRGIIAPEPLRAIVSHKIGSLDAVKQELKREVLKKHSWHELSDVERGNLISAIELVNAVTPCQLDEVDITDFRSDDLQGLYKDGRFILAKRLLNDREETLEVLVHEVSHRAGSDGKKSHVATIEGIWSGIVGNLRQQLSDPNPEAC